ncbi:ATP-binding protein [Microbacterium gubbeenense]|uniref:ATP-binding protein n=1 Tax=Microbacterium gubbeenense TaxID=159896 RepID=UPI003F9D1701
MEIGTKEGWREYVDAIYDRPVPVTVDELREMSFGERAMYKDARARYAQAGAFVKTPQYNTVRRATRERITANKFRQVGKLGVILSGAPGQGKTTTLLQIGKEHELRRRQTSHPAAAKGNIPVVYVAVPAQCTAKALMGEFARFLGLPAHPRRTYGELMDTVANALRRCSTELILIDDVHHLDLRYRQNIEASDMLKQLSERCGGTFVYAGIDVEETGLLSGTREGQIRKRFEVHTAEPYRILDDEERSDWGDLLLAIEDSLCLLKQQKGAILAAALDLHRLSNGEIGVLKDMLQIAAIRAIEDGVEELDIGEFPRKVAQLQKRAAAQLVG